MPLPVVIGGVLAIALVALLRAVIVGFLRFVIKKGLRNLIFAIATVNLDTIIAWLEEWYEAESTKEFILSHVNGLIVSVAYEKIGIRLDDDDPLSKVSFSRGVSGLVGFEIVDVTDKDSVLNGAGRYMAQQINLQLHTQFDSLWPIADMKEQLGREAFVAMTNALQGAPSFVTAAQAGTIRSLLHQIDGVFVNRTAKTDRKAQLARAAQRKYSLTHRRVGGTWVPR